MNRDTLAGFFTDLSQEHGEFLAYDDGFRTWKRSYADVTRAAYTCAARLRDHGLTKGDKIVFWSENRPEWIAALWGCVLEGVIAVPIDFRSSAEFVARIAAIVQARVVFIGDSVPALPPLPQTTAVWKLAGLDWPAHDVAVPEAPALQPDDVAEIVFTSGATAEPKGVLITHRNLLSNIVPIEKEVRKYRPWGRPFYPLRFLNLLPLSHLFGQSLATFIPPMIAGTVVFRSSYRPADILRQIHARRISVLVSVPKILEVLRDHVLHEFPETSQAATGLSVARKWWRYRRVHRAFGWKFWAFVVGAAPLDPEIESFWARLGFLVIQGYGLTETAPIVTLNHPFHARPGTVGTPIGGVEVRLAEDGEILVRGGNVSQGYFGGGENGSGSLDPEGWLHTGDLGEKDAEGRFIVRGRKKEMIVLPDGRKVFPADVEAVLRHIPGVRDSAVVGPDQVHAVLAVDPGANTEEIVRLANGRLEEHQKIRAVSVWPSGEELPRTPGTRKLKRGEILARISGLAQPGASVSDEGLAGLLRRYAPGREITPETTLDQLGLSSLDRIQLLMEMEQRLDTPLDEAAFAAARTVADLERPRGPESSSAAREPAERLDFPVWNRSWPARWLRRAAAFALLRPLTRFCARLSVGGLENLKGLQPPVIFAPNHQSFLDVPAILCALPSRWRSRVAPAMAKEWFTPYFHPEGSAAHPRPYSKYEHFISGLQYYLASLFFNALPLPQREAGTREALHYMGDLIGQGWCVLVFPEGDRTHHGELLPFRPGIAMLASHVRVPVVPVRIQGLERVLNRDASHATPGPVKISFGAPLLLEGSDYAAQAKRLEEAVHRLG